MTTIGTLGIRDVAPFLKSLGGTPDKSHRFICVTRSVLLIACTCASLILSGPGAPFLALRSTLVASDSVTISNRSSFSGYAIAGVLLSSSEGGSDKVFQNGITLSRGRLLDSSPHPTCHEWLPWRCPIDVLASHPEAWRISRALPAFCWSFFPPPFWFELPFARFGSSPCGLPPTVTHGSVPHTHFFFLTVNQLGVGLGLFRVEQQSALAHLCCQTIHLIIEACGRLGEDDYVIRESEVREHQGCHRPLHLKFPDISLTIHWHFYNFPSIFPDIIHQYFNQTQTQECP